MNFFLSFILRNKSQALFIHSSKNDLTADYILSHQHFVWFFCFDSCTVTVKLQPEPLMEHLEEGPGQPWSTGEGNSAVGREGVEPGCTCLRPHLRAGCGWGRSSGWRSLPGAVFLMSPGLRRWVSTFLFLCDTIPFPLVLLLLCSYITLPPH